MNAEGSPDRVAWWERYALPIAVVTGVVSGYLAKGATELTGWGFAGLVVGAALPPILAKKDRWQPWRILAAIVAVVVVGFISITAIDAAADRPPTLPGQPTTEDQGEGGDDEDGGGNRNGSETPTPTRSADVLAEDGLEITVTPATLRCDSQQGCEQRLTIENTGEEDLVIDEIEVTGNDSEYFDLADPPECSNTTLPARDSCTFDLAFRQTGSDDAREALLEIHQNLVTRRESRVRLSGSGPPTTTVPDWPAPEVTGCVIVGTEARLTVVVRSPAQSTELQTVPVELSVGGETNQRDLPVDEATQPNVTVQLNDDGTAPTVALRTAVSEDSDATNNATTYTPCE